MMKEEEFLEGENIQEQVQGMINSIINASVMLDVGDRHKSEDLKNISTMEIYANGSLRSIRAIQD